jgi:hypothetical protein
MGTPATDAVKRLVDRFDQDRKVFLSGDYKEEQLRHTAGHQAKVEEKPEVRKAGGVYYTPTYIVDYIVKNTVGRLHEGGPPARLTNACRRPGMRPVQTQPRPGLTETPKKVSVPDTPRICARFSDKRREKLARVVVAGEAVEVESASEEESARLLIA